MEDRNNNTAKNLLKNKNKINDDLKEFKVGFRKDEQENKEEKNVPIKETYEKINEEKMEEILNKFNDINNDTTVDKVINKHKELINNFDKDNKNTIKNSKYTKNKNEKINGSDDYVEEIIKNGSDNNNDISNNTINKSVYIINSSLYNIKNNLTNIKNVINLNEESEDDETISDNYKSDDSSIVKTFENLKDEEYLDNKNSQDLELLLKTVINTKKEEKQFTTLDIIDECISIGNIYSANKNKQQIFNKINDSVSKNENITGEKNISLENREMEDNYIEDVDLDNVDILEKILKINKVENHNEDIIESTSNYSLNESNHKTGIEKQNLVKESSNLEQKNLNYKDENINIEEEKDIDGERNKIGESSIYKKYMLLTKHEWIDMLYKFKDFLRNEEKKLKYFINTFLKRKNKLKILLKNKKKVCYFILHIFFFFSYIFFPIFFIFLKRIFYHIIFDQDL